MPYSSEQHGMLKSPHQPNQSRGAGVADGSGAAVSGSGRQPPLLSLFFGRRQGPARRRPQTRPGGRSPQPSQAGSAVSAAAAVPSTNRPGVAGAVTASAAAQGSHVAASAKATCDVGQSQADGHRVYPWQKHRGSNNQDLYVAKLESRREELRQVDLSLDEDLLVEWTELTKERDVVLRCVAPFLYT